MQSKNSAGHRQNTSECKTKSATTKKNSNPFTRGTHHTSCNRFPNVFSKYFNFGWNFAPQLQKRPPERFAASGRRGYSGFGCCFRVDDGLICRHFKTHTHARLRGSPSLRFAVELLIGFFFFGAAINGGGRRRRRWTLCNRVVRTCVGRCHVS